MYNTVAQSGFVGRVGTGDLSGGGGVIPQAAYRAEPQ